MASYDSVKYRKYYLENRERLIIKQTKYNGEHREERNAHDREYYWKNREKILVRQKAYREINKEKRSAEMKAWWAIPISSHCVHCGSMRSLERHHPNYGKPYEVFTLCRSCHMKLHLGLKKA